MDFSDLELIIKYLGWIWNMFDGYDAWKLYYEGLRASWPSGNGTRCLCKYSLTDNLLKILMYLFGKIDLRNCVIWHV